MYGTVSATTTRLFKTAGIEGLNSILTMGSWFENTRCYGRPRKEVVLHYLDMIEIGKSVTPKSYITKLLESKTVARGIMWSTGTPMMKVRLISCLNGK